MENATLAKNFLAVGAIWFACRTEDCEDSEAYFSQLQESLGEIESLTNLEISGADGAFGTTITVKHPREDPKEPLVLSHVYDVRLSFDLYIPFKVQDEIGAKCPAENFHVTIINHYYFPITYVVTSGAAGFDDFSATSAIVLIRKYLEQKLKSGPITCSCIGPSPFHASFRGIPEKEEPRLYDNSVEPGYRRYEFYFEGSPDNFLRAFAHRYGGALSLYYALQNMRSTAIEKSREIQADVDTLLTIIGKGFWGSLFSASQRRSLIDRISENILRDERCRTAIQHNLEEFEHDDLGGSFADLKPQFAELERFANGGNYESERQITDIAEARNRSVAESAAILVAGLMGGILGSVITYFLTAGGQS